MLMIPLMSTSWKVVSIAAVSWAIFRFLVLLSHVDDPTHVYLLESGKHRSCVLGHLQISCNALSHPCHLLTAFPSVTDWCCLLWNWGCLLWCVCCFFRWYFAFLGRLRRACFNTWCTTWHNSRHRIVDLHSRFQIYKKFFHSPGNTTGHVNTHLVRFNDRND